jgi:MraZ protein
VWQRVQARLRELSRREEHRKQVLRAAAMAVPVTPDKQGRILIPDWMREGIGLKSEARVVGMFDHIEIWEPESFSKVLLEDDDDSEDLLTSIVI